LTKAPKRYLSEVYFTLNYPNGLPTSDQKNLSSSSKK
jgi:hypothetical protein